MSIKVHFTKDLSIFRFSHVNRDIENNNSKKRIKRIAQSMMDEGLLPHPIIVNSKMVIIDGQHRVKAAEIAGCGIHYIVDDGIPNSSKAIFNSAIRYNRDAKVWSPNDYTHGHAQQGNVNYQTLEEFSKEFPMFSFTDHIMFLVNSGTKRINKDDFLLGKLKINNLETARLWAFYMLQLKPHFDKGYNKSGFVRAMLTVLEKKPEFNFEEFIKKVQLRPASLHLCGDKRGYLDMIEDIYNYHRRANDKINLRF